MKMVLNIKQKDDRDLFKFNIYVYKIYMYMCVTYMCMHNNYNLL